MKKHAADEKVLVVDDDPQVLTSIKHLLEDDFEILTETNPQRALQRLEDRSIEVILADQRMPELEGDKFLAQARGISRATRILMTAYSDQEALVRAVNAAHIFSYVPKPWDPEALQRLIRTAAAHFRKEQESSKPEEAGANDSSNDPVGGTNDPWKARKHMRVFLVDDDSEDIVLATKAWQKTGIPRALCIARNGQELLDYLHSTDVDEKTGVLPLPDLIFLDINMPQKNGFEILIELKSDLTLKNIPIVMLTGSGSEEDIRQAYALGAAGFIIKPTNLKSLAEVMKVAAMYWSNVVKLPARQLETSGK